MRFEWDPGKAAENLAKHGVSFEEAATVFRDALSATGSEPDHSFDEERFVTFGISTGGRILAIAHTDHGVRALQRARAAGYSDSVLIRKGLRVAAFRYYTRRRPPSTRLFESRQQSRRTTKSAVNLSSSEISRLEFADRR